MTCPFLEYREADDDQEFDHERPYCAAADEFVSPMKADICNDRFQFDHEADCEVYKAHIESGQQDRELPAQDDD
jgi:hypothetical protein